MDTKARCKFSVGSVKDSRDSNGVLYQQVIKLHTLYDENDPEDTRFSEATPWGSMEFGLSNPRLLGQFKAGDVFYVDLSPTSGG